MEEVNKNTELENTDKKLHISDVSDLKKYCKYLIDEYEKIKSGEGGRVMIDLTQFYEEGRIKDLIFKNTSNKSKINLLNIYRNKILFFANSRGIELELMNFEDFSNH